MGMFPSYTNRVLSISLCTCTCRCCTEERKKLCRRCRAYQSTVGGVGLRTCWHLTAGPGQFGKKIWTVTGTLECVEEDNARCIIRFWKHLVATITKSKHVKGGKK